MEETAEAKTEKELRFMNKFTNDDARIRDDKVYYTITCYVFQYYS